MINFRIIAFKLGEGLQYTVFPSEVDRVATAIFGFQPTSHKIDGIYFSNFKLIYDWVMSLAEQKIKDEEKVQLLQEFINALTPQNSPLRNLIKETTHLFNFDFWSIIHKSIIDVSKKKFEDGHYSDAVESALKEINMRVKKIVKDKIGQELDGSALMQRAFSLENPIILLEDLTIETGKNIQKGYLQIFAGTMTGIRNPKAHENIVIEQERAVHFLFLANLLMQILDESNY